MLIWERDGATYYARAENVETGTVCYLVVEPLPAGGWDWQVWRKSRDAKPAWRGVTLTCADAMNAAECVAEAAV